MLEMSDTDTDSFEPTMVRITILRIVARWCERVKGRWCGTSIGAQQGTENVHRYYACCKPDPTLYLDRACTEGVRSKESLTEKVDSELQSLECHRRGLRLAAMCS